MKKTKLPIIRTVCDFAYGFEDLGGGGVARSFQGGLPACPCPGDTTNPSLSASLADANYSSLMLLEAKGAKQPRRIG